MSRAHLTEVELPDFGMPGSMPVLPDSIYQDRMERLRKGAAERGYDRIASFTPTASTAPICPTPHRVRPQVRGLPRRGR